MEDEKLAAYYDDLSRRGGGAARFKQGLGFSSNNSSTNDDVPSKGSALPTTSSFFSSFVKASSPSKTAEFEKQAQLQSIQNKLSRKPKEETRNRSPSRNSRGRSRSPSRDRIRDKYSKRGSPSRDKIRDNHTKHRSRSRSHSRDRYSRFTSRSRDRRSGERSRSREDGSRRRHRSRSRSRSRSRRRERSKGRSKREGSPVGRRPGKGKKPGEVRRGGGIDYAKLIDGYDNMTQAERVKAKMKLQLAKAAENDETIGKSSGWERFDFDKDAPLDDEEIEEADDDAALVKHIGQSFRFSAVESRKEEEMKAVHDEAMFGAPSYSYPPPAETDDEADERSHKNESDENAPVASLLSDQVRTMQKGSWRNRARKP